MVRKGKRPKLRPVLSRSRDGAVLSLPCVYGTGGQSFQAKFLRTVDMQLNTELPIFKPELGQFVEGKPPFWNESHFGAPNTERNLHLLLVEPTGDTQMMRHKVAAMDLDFT